MGWTDTSFCDAATTPTVLVLPEWFLVGHSCVANDGEFVVHVCHVNEILTSYQLLVRD